MVRWVFQYTWKEAQTPGETWECQTKCLITTHLCWSANLRKFTALAQMFPGVCGPCQDLHSSFCHSGFEVFKLSDLACLLRRVEADYCRQKIKTPDKIWFVVSSICILWLQIICHYLMVSFVFQSKTNMPQSQVCFWCNKQFLWWCRVINWNICSLICLRCTVKRACGTFLACLWKFHEGTMPENEYWLSPVVSHIPSHIDVQLKIWFQLEFDQTARLCFVHPSGAIVQPHAVHIHLNQTSIYPHHSLSVTSCDSDVSWMSSGLSDLASSHSNNTHIKNPLFISHGEPNGCFHDNV